MITLINSFREIVASYEVKRYQQLGGAYEFVALIEFNDKSTRYIRDYVFGNGSRKYSFQWQDFEHQLILRWDNAPHYLHLSSFPFHMHTPESVEQSPPMTLFKVLEHIRQHLIKI